LSFAPHTVWMWHGCGVTYQRRRSLRRRTTSEAATLSHHGRVRHTRRSSSACHVGTTSVCSGAGSRTTSEATGASYAGVRTSSVVGVVVGFDGAEDRIKLLYAQGGGGGLEVSRAATAIASANCCAVRLTVCAGRDSGENTYSPYRRSQSHINPVCRSTANKPHCPVRKRTSTFAHRQQRREPPAQQS
jgi:hypothetical protein